jgi:protein required for attachment to host cells
MLARQFDRLVLVAPAQFIGDLRDELPKDLKAKIDREITADLTKTPRHQLHSQLGKMLYPAPPARD